MTGCWAIKSVLAAVRDVERVHGQCIIWLTRFLDPHLIYLFWKKQYNAVLSFLCAQVSSKALGKSRVFAKGSLTASWLSPGSLRSSHKSTHMVDWSSVWLVRVG